MKKLTVSTLALFLLLILAGCGIFGNNPSPPSKAEGYLFDVITNLVPRPIFKTNIVDVPVTVYVLKTNEQNEIHQLTNTVILKDVQLEKATNWVEAYTWIAKTNTVQYAQTAGTVANMVMPGSGGLVTGLLTAGLLAWGKLRSSKRTNTSLAQGTETLLELLQTLPDGNKNVAAAKQFLQKSQSNDGVTKQVKAARSDVDNLQAKADVSQIKNTIRTFSAPNVPGNPAGQV